MPARRLVSQIKRLGADAGYLAGLNGVSVVATRVRLQELGVAFVRDVLSLLLALSCDGACQLSNFC